MPLASRSENTCTDVPGIATSRWFPDGPPVGFGDPSTHQEESSDSHWDSNPSYATPSGFLNLLTLYSALDPSGLVSCRWRPWASTFSGFPSAVASVASQRPLSLLSFTPPTDVGLVATPRICAPAESVTLRRCYPVNSARSALGFLPSEVFTSSVSAAGATPQPPLLGLARRPTAEAAHRRTCSAKFQRTGEAGLSLSRETLPPWGF
jgi:hypothetical protein